MAGSRAYRETFTVPATLGAYAPERITFGDHPLIGVTIAVEDLGGATDAVLELWLLRPGGDAENDAHYFFSGKTRASLGCDTYALASWRGAQLRVKSGGTGGLLVGSASADY